MTPANRWRLAVMLADARRSGRQINALPPELVPASNDEGYAVNALVAETLGWEPLGWKIAGTNAVMQQRLRTGEPIHGRTFARFGIHVEDRASKPVQLPHAELLDPIVECELMFRLAKDLPAHGAPYSESAVADAVKSVHVGVEIAECRFPLDALPPMPAILADGAASGRYLVGPAIADWREQDLAALSVTLMVNGEERRRGSGREVMGDPIRALAWLASKRARLGDGLTAGDIVSTGTTTGMLLAKPGDRMEARFGDTLRLTFEFAR